MILHLSPEQGFQCHSCGRCCRNSWSIRVEPSARPDIEASQAAAAVRRDGYLPLQVLADSTIATGHRGDGACVYLTPETLCSLHGELGGQRKPLACQLYPYALTSTPDGYYAYLSFACPSVVEGKGGDPSANRRELEHILSERSVGMEVAARVPVLRERFVSWESYRALEPVLLDAFRAHDPVGSLLSAAVGVTVVMAGTQEGQDPEWPDLSAIRREEAFEESMLAMFCASVIALWELPHAPEQRQAFSQSILQAGPIRSERHRLDLPTFDFGPFESPRLQDTFRRYFDNAVFGKSLLVMPVVSRLLMLACGFALTAYYAEAFRRSSGSDELEWEALCQALELVEADLVSHTRSADPLFLTFEDTLAQIYGAG